MKKLIVTLFLGICLSSTYGQESSKTVYGTVFLDKNQNGILDRGEKGIKNALISNGLDIVSTDKNGKYKLTVQKGQSIFPILSSAHTINSKLSKKVLNANFWYAADGASSTINFPLTKQHIASQFKVGGIGDIQVDNEEEISFAAKSILSELANREDLDFNLILGDLVNDKPKLLPEVGQLLEQVPTPSWTLVGNHDRNVTNPEAMDDAFNAVFGADTYAFNYGEAHFLVLNNVFSTGKNGYEGRISEDQLQFVKNDLKHVAKNKLLVINQHIPMYGTKNREDLFALLEGFSNVLILSGHTHVLSRHLYNNGAIQEIGVGATCGTWWRGEKDTYGVPEALMACGGPRGYFVLDIKGNRYDMTFKAVGQDETKQINVFVDSTKIIANVFAGSDSTTVLCRINDGEWLPMKKSREVDPKVAQIVENNRAKIYPSVGSTVNPLRARPSNHVWILPCSDFKKDKNYKIQIKANDRFGFQVEEDFLIRL